MKNSISEKEGDKTIKNVSTENRSFVLKPNPDQPQKNLLAPIQNSPAKHACFECTICKRNFNDKEQLKSHMESKHVRKRLKCKICPKTFSGRFTLKSHIQSVHEGPTTRRPFQCKLCPENFSFKLSLGKHILSHGKQEQFNCQKCNATFTNINDLNSHNKSNHKTFEKVRILKHSKKRGFNCQKCDATFTNLPDLNTHNISVHKMLENVPNDKHDQNCEGASHSKNIRQSGYVCGNTNPLMQKLQIQG